MVQILNQGRKRNAESKDEDHLAAAVSWLERAQDASGDGGVAGRFDLRNGWSSSYPETTGYIIPTWLKLAKVQNDDRFIARAERCVRFLLSTQLDSGAFPGGEIAENRTEPSSFNSAQIIHGLVAWHQETGDNHALDAAIRAADWMVSVQEDDGAFRKYCYREWASTYSAHASCWLAELGRYIEEPRYAHAANRHLGWVLSNFIPEDGWFDHCGFDADEQTKHLATAHTIAYTICGVLYMSQLLGREDGVQAARSAALRALRCAEIHGNVPGVMNSKWDTAADFSCLTGAAQFAIIWLKLFELDHDPGYLNAALSAIDDVKRAQVMHQGHSGLRGGIAGSNPIWGDYLNFALPNWAAKFFIDAMLMKAEVLSRHKFAEEPEQPLARIAI